MRAGATLDQIQAQLSVLSQRLQREYVEDWTDERNLGRVLTAVEERRSRINPRARPLLVGVAGFFLGAAGLILLIACSNITNLLLARAGVRRQEFGIRMALGAGRSRLLRQLIVENLVLGALGGIFGLLLAFWAMPLLLNLLPVGTPRADQVALDLRVLGFTFLLSLAASLSFGVIPALHSSRKGAGLALKKGTAGRNFRLGGKRLMNAMIVAEVALSLVMLAASGLMLRSFWQLQGVDPGFGAEGVVTMLLSPS